MVATDANQAFFKFQTDSTNSESFTDFEKLHFVHSIANTDYISRLPITVAASTNYHLKISFDSDRKLSIFVNGVQYTITATSGSTGGVFSGTETGSSATTTYTFEVTPTDAEAQAGAAREFTITISHGASGGGQFN